MAKSNSPKKSSSGRRAEKILRTASEIARSKPEEPPLGEYLWQRTNQVVFPSPVVSMSGLFNEDLVYHTRQTDCFVRSASAGAQEPTAYQMGQRERFAVAQKSWKLLTEEERVAWGRYAMEVRWPQRKGSQRLAGMNCHSGAQCHRLAWGTERRSQAPVTEVPVAARVLEEVAAPPGMMAFRVEHDQPDLQGCRLLFDVSPALPTLKCTAREWELSHGAVTDAASYFPLAPSGAVYLLEQPRQAIAPGQTYAVRVRLLNDDGIAGEALRRDLIRQETLPS